VNPGTFMGVAHVIPGTATARKLAAGKAEACPFASLTTILPTNGYGFTSGTCEASWSSIIMLTRRSI
jgi:hypothetical protein